MHRKNIISRKADRKICQGGNSTRYILRNKYYSYSLSKFNNIYKFKIINKRNVK